MNKMNSINIIEKTATAVYFTFNGHMYTIDMEDNELHANGPHNGLSMEAEQDFESGETIYNFNGFSIVVDAHSATVQ